MGEFYDSIKGDLDKLDAGFEADHAPDPHAGVVFGIVRHSRFGADYNSNAGIVKQVQTAINSMGYTPQLSVDGAYGPVTEAGVKWAQGSLGITADGVIGDATLQELGITPPTVSGAAATVANTTNTTLEQAAFQPLLDWAQKNPQPITQGSGVAPGFQATRDSVVKSYVPWTTPLEGFLPFMYIDALGYVTLFRLFTGNQTGNTVALSVSIGHHDGATVLRRGFPIARWLTRFFSRALSASYNARAGSPRATLLLLPLARFDALVLPHRREREAWVRARARSCPQQPS